MSSEDNEPRGRGYRLMRLLGADINKSKDMTIRGRGRGVLLNNLKEHYNSKAALGFETAQPELVSISPSSYIGTAGPLRSVVCSSVLVPPLDLFEYEVVLQPESADYNCVLSKAFGGDFVYDQGSAYTLRRLKDTELVYSVECINATLKYKGEINLRDRPVLLETLLKTHMKKMYTVQAEVCKVGAVISIKQQFHTKQNRTVQELIEEFKSVYKENYRQALSLFVVNTLIWYEPDSCVYQLIEVNSNDRFVKVKGGKAKFVAASDCYLTKLIRDDCPEKIISDLRTVFDSFTWNLGLNCIVAKARVLQSPSVIFDDDVKVVPQNGKWPDALKENDFCVFMELWCWALFYTPQDKSRAETFVNKLNGLREDIGISIGVPLLFEIPKDSKQAYGDALQAVISGGECLQLIAVITPTSQNKPDALIKRICTGRCGIPYQLIPSASIGEEGKVFEAALRMSVVLGAIPWSVDLNQDKSLICGIDLREKNKLSVCSFVTALTSDSTQWYSKAMFVERHFEECVRDWLKDVVRKYRSTNGTFPKKLVIYQNYEDDQARAALVKLYREFNFNDEIDLKICVVLVNKSANTTYFKNLTAGPARVPPGTVVDDTITNNNRRDFFLTTSLPYPAYYDVILDTCGFTPDEIQALTYKMCHLYYAKAEVSDVPAVCSYAKKLSLLILDEVFEIPSAILDESLYYL